MGALSAALWIPLDSAAGADGANPAAASAASALARFDFEDDGFATGPDTLAVFEHAKGRVRLSREIVRGGWRSLMLRDAAGDRDFPELQAFFPERRAGVLRLAFALLVTDPREELNVALAGPAGFGLGRDGIAVWLATRDGYLIHTSDSIPRRIHPLTSFVWYRIELAYRLESGRYDLRLLEEGVEPPVVSLARQPNAASQPGSAVRLLSFIGDNGDDRSNVVYFVDDIELAADHGPRLRPFLAPGRRKLFVERLEGYGQPLGAVPACPEPLDVEELGGERGGGIESVAALVGAAYGSPTSAAASGASPELLEAVRRWRTGCAALARSDWSAALDELGAAIERSNGAFLYRLARLAALVGARQIAAAEAVVAELDAFRPGDPRVAALAARIASARGFTGEAESWFDAAVAARQSPVELEATASGAFHWLMGEERFGEAEAFARTMEERHRAPERAQWRARWVELVGDAAFGAGEAERAAAAYRVALELAPEGAARLDLKLADVAFATGDLAAERRLRESIYGTLLGAE